MEDSLLPVCCEIPAQKGIEWFRETSLTHDRAISLLHHFPRPMLGLNNLRIFSFPLIWSVSLFIVHFQRRKICEILQDFWIHLTNSLSRATTKFYGNFSLVGIFNKGQKKFFFKFSDKNFLHYISGYLWFICFLPKK